MLIGLFFGRRVGTVERLIIRAAQARVDANEALEAAIEDRITAINELKDDLTRLGVLRNRLSDA